MPVFLEDITSRKLQHVLRSYKHEAFQKANDKLDLIEQPYLDSLDKKYILANDNCRRALNTRNLPSKAVLEFSFPVIVFLLLHFVSSFPFLNIQAARPRRLKYCKVLSKLKQ